MKEQFISTICVSRYAIDIYVYQLHVHAQKLLVKKDRWLQGAKQCSQSFILLPMIAHIF